MSDAVRVSALSVTPVKATRLHTVTEIELTETGATGDRVLCLVDERGRMVNGKVIRDLQTVVADLELASGNGQAVASGELALTFPDGHRVRGGLEYGETIEISFFARPEPAQVVAGPFAEALSDHFGRSVRLVAPEIGADRGREGAASLISSGSLRRLAEQAQTDAIDARRFRMLIQVDGLQPHAEDEWVGRRVRVGEALVAFNGHVGRCAITTRDPETAEVTLPTLKLLAAYRAETDSSEPLPFGIYGRVLEPGRVRVGDAVTVASRG